MKQLMRFAYEKPCITDFEKKALLQTPSVDNMKDIAIDRIQLMHMTDGSENNNVYLHSHSFIEILFLTKGRLSYLLESQIYDVEEGDVLVIPKDILHKPLYQSLKDDSYGRYVLWLPADSAAIKLLLTETDERFYTTPVLIRTVGNARNKIMEYFKEGERVLKQKEACCYTEFTGIILQLLSYICRFTGESFTRSSNKKLIIDNVVWYIHQHISENLALDNISTELSISVSYLERLFRNELGMSVHSYIQQYRVDLARKKIQQGEAIEHVCYEVGFKDYSTFYRAFYKFYNCTPREMQRTGKAR